MFNGGSKEQGEGGVNRIEESEFKISRALLKN